MADQGVWFKLWCSALSDPDLANLSLADFARWCILGTYIKAHGTAGELRLTAPARALSGLLQVGDFAALQEVFHRLPNVCMEKDNSAVSSETVLIVSLRNWAKYQGDYSTHRVRKFREMKRSKRRGEEKRGEEKRGEEKKKYPPSSPLSDGNGTGFQIAASILEALNDCPSFRETARLRLPAYWQAEIRAVDVDFPTELRKAQAWLAANPARAPRKDMARFLHNWFSRAEERSHA